MRPPTVVVRLTMREAVELGAAVGNSTNCYDDAFAILGTRASVAAAMRAERKLHDAIREARARVARKTSPDVPGSG